MVQSNADFAKWLFAQSCRFVLGAADPKQVPATDYTEVALVGRSNVGKSSLLNAIVRRKDMARVSNTPGRTQQLNFFELGQQLMVVDLPGYGFAKAGKEKAKTWTKLMKAYLKGRPQLRRVYLLVDSRHGLKESDLEMMDMLDEAAVSYAVVLTKTDKIVDRQLRDVIAQVEETMPKHPACYPEVLPSSSQTGFGVIAIQENIAALVKS